MRRLNQQLEELYFLSESREQELWESSWFAFDTSALLSFYYYSENTRQNLVTSVFSPLKTRLVIPQHVEFEYIKNRKKTLLKPISEKYEKEIEQDCIEIAEHHLSKFKGALTNLSSRTQNPDKHPHLDAGLVNSFTPTVAAFQNEFEAFIHKVKDEIASRKQDIEKLEFSDPVLTIIEKYFKVGKNLSFSEQLDIAKDGALRYANKIPPGYQDQSQKDGLQKYGDLFVWRQLIALAHENEKNIIFISDDTKDDWWVKSGKVPSRPREELIKEFHDNTGVYFWMYTTEQLLYKAYKILGSPIEENTLQEVSTISETRNLEQGDILLEHQDAMWQTSLGSPAKMAVGQWLRKRYGDRNVKPWRDGWPSGFIVTLPNGQTLIVRSKFFIGNKTFIERTYAFIKNHIHEDEHSVDVLVIVAINESLCALAINQVRMRRLYLDFTLIFGVVESDESDFIEIERIEPS